MTKEKKTEEVAYNQKYPLMAFRLSPDMVRKVRTTAKEKEISKSRVVKDALELYFKRASV